MWEREQEREDDMQQRAAGWKETRANDARTQPCTCGPICTARALAFIYFCLKSKTDYFKNDCEF